ncbi:Dicer-like protein 1 [Geranomyces variabilis]|nr:Dicer-like protein 1 [Geranomyces variabilis]
MATPDGFPIITSGLKPVDDFGKLPGSSTSRIRRMRPTARQLKDSGKYEPSAEADKGPREISRNYQLEIFKQAKEGNVVVVMDTGTGKTLPAALLIKHMLAIEEERRKNGAGKRIALFLVPTVPLVWQQKDYLMHHIEENVAPLCGRTMQNEDSKSAWEKRIRENGVVCATAEIIKQALQHAFLTMEQICLIVFDEAHHALGDHPYALLMNEHYKLTDKRHRPKILGLTASPVASNNEALVAIENLEKTLNCKAITIVLSEEESKRFAARAKPERVKYNGNRDADLKSPLLDKLEEHAARTSDDHLQKPIEDGRYIMRELGTWACARTIISGLDNIQIKSDRSVLNPIAWNVSEQHATLDRERKRFMQELQGLRPGELPQPDEISDKVLKLIAILEEYRNDPTFSAIVFVQRRETAERLANLLQQCPQTNTYLRVGALRGESKSKEFETTSRFTEQSRILREFRTHNLNLIVATKVAEEGIDVPMCKLVVRFDMGKESMNLVNFIQCRGRARAINSRFIVLLEDDNWEHSSHLRLLQQRETEAREQILKQENVIPTTETMTEFTADDLDVARAAPYTYTVEATNARVSLTSAAGILNHFCSLLEVDVYTRGRPEYACDTGMVGNERTYTASVTLPNLLPINLRFVTGPAMRSKTLALRAAALETVKMLHARKYLDNHLRPIFNEKGLSSTFIQDGADMEKLQRDLMSLRSKKKKGVWEIMMPEILLKPWRATESAVITAHLNTVDVTAPNQAQATSALGFLTVAQLPISPLEFQLWPNMVENKVHLHSSHKVLELTEKQYHATRKYSHLVLAPMLKEKIFPDAEYAMLMVPLKIPADGGVVDIDAANPSMLIDWEAIYSCLSFIPMANRKVLYTDDVTDMVIQDTKHFNRKFLALERVEQNPFEDVPFADPKVKCAADFYRGVKHKEIIKKDQKVIRARLVTRKFNMLASHSIAEVEAVDSLRDGDVFLIPQFCRPYSVGQKIMHASVIFPSIFYYTEVACRAAELREKLHLPVTLPKLVEALAAPSAVMQTSYERLETLGDAFLKIAITLHLYALHPHRHEGVMTMMSHRLQSNWALFQQAVQRGLPGYMVTAKLTRSLWRPMLSSESWEQTSGCVPVTATAAPAPGEKKAEPSAVSTRHQLSTKQIADVFESIVGACLDDNGVRGAAKALNRMYHESFRSNWSDYVLALEDVPKPQGEMRVEKRIAVERVQEIIKYKFNDPWLLAEALTHPSCPDLSTQSYQRLEFLGDAILGMLAVRYFYEKYPDLPPGRLTDLKDSAVNNNFLACVAANLGLHVYIDKFSSPMDQDIADYCSELYIEARRHEESAAEREALLEKCRMGSFESKSERNALQRQVESEMQYWMNIETPKAVSDVFEAIIGAVFVDNNFSEEAVWKFMQPTWLPWVDKYCLPHIVGRHPYRELALYMRGRLQCDSWRMTCTQDTDGGAYIANMFVHDKLVKTCAGPSRKSARRLLSELLMEALEEDAEYFKEMCDCGIARKANGQNEAEWLEGYDGGLLETDVATMEVC